GAADLLFCDRLSGAVLFSAAAGACPTALRAWRSFLWRLYLRLAARAAGAFVDTRTWPGWACHCHACACRAGCGAVMGDGREAGAGAEAPPAFAACHRRPAPATSW